MRAAGDARESRAVGTPTHDAALRASPALLAERGRVRLSTRGLSGARSPRAGEVGLSQLLELGSDRRVCLSRADAHRLVHDLQPAESVETPQLAIGGRVPS